MTRLAVLSDIHGNLPALEAVIADMEGEHFDRVVVAGDLINIGPWSREVLEAVFERGWAVIRGNHEHYLLDRVALHLPQALKDRAFLDFLAEQLGEAWQARLAVMPDELSLRFADAPPLRVVHAAPGNPFRTVTPVTAEDNALAMLAGTDERSIVAGHYHMAFERRLAQWQFINPGPVGTPHDGLQDACYAVLEGDARGWRVEHRRLPVGSSALLEEMQRLGYVERFGLRGHIIIEQFRLARPLFVSFRRWVRQQHPGQEWSYSLLDEFLRGGHLWHALAPEYQFNRHLLDPAPIDREQPDR
ncbi:MAG: metallophosphoesterase family protein [Anaerolineaceae bacterium]|nr:metallophosphoesterase family protein [Anaerolineaceae bacterium]